MLAIPMPVPRRRGGDLQDLLASGPSAEQIADFLRPAGSAPPTA
jgi:hypothetical protein